MLSHRSGEAPAQIVGAVLIFDGFDEAQRRRAPTLRPRDPAANFDAPSPGIKGVAGANEPMADALAVGVPAFDAEAGDRAIGKITWLECDMDKDCNELFGVYYTDRKTTGDINFRRNDIR